MEEHGASRLAEGEAYKVYCLADDLLKQTQDAELIARLRASARSAGHRLAGVRLGEGFSVSEAVKDYEAKFIQRALADAEGSVSRAAKKLGINYQKRVYLL